MIRVRTTGVEQTKAMLHYHAEKIPDGARKTMHRIADKVVKRAQLMAPVDKHNLEESIHKVVSYETRGRLLIAVEMGGFVNGVNVDDYATEMHENYESYNMGPGTQAKQMANPGVRIGSKFLTRAIEEAQRTIESEIISVIERVKPT